MLGPMSILEIYKYVDISAVYIHSLLEVFVLRSVSEFS